MTAVLTIIDALAPRPHLTLERRDSPDRRRGRPRALDRRLRRMVCEWVDAGVDVEAMRTALAYLGCPVSQKTIYRYRNACPIDELHLIQLQCDRCGARSSTGTCPNGHPINPHY